MRYAVIHTAKGDMEITEGAYVENMIELQAPHMEQFQQAIGKPLLEAEDTELGIGDTFDGEKWVSSSSEDDEITTE